MGAWFSSGSHGASAVRVFESGGGALYRLDLPPVFPGFERFLTPWVMADSARGRNVVVDVGPAATLPALLGGLDDLGVKRVDLVLVTHAHIDHVGGLGDFLARHPQAKVVAHPKGHPHLVEPSRLMQASIQTLGEIGRAYGPISPVPADSLLPGGSTIDGLEVIDTPGHSPHHFSFVYRLGDEKVMFVGEALGLYSWQGSEPPDEDAPGFLPYIRPATPPRFFYDVSMRSVDELRRRDASLMCYGHFGYARRPRLLMDLHARQFGLWKAVVERTLGEQRARGASREETVDAVFRNLLAEDRHLGDFHGFTGDVGAREASFIRNSIKGFIGYIEESGGVGRPRPGSGEDSLRDARRNAQ